MYEHCLAVELEEQGVPVERQVWMPVRFRGQIIPHAFRVDLMVAGRLVVEVKAVESVAPIHRAQLLTYLKLSGVPLGLLLNFNSYPFRDGIHRVKVG